MRHRNHSNRLAQKPHHAWMMLRNMLTSLVLYERIRTTKKRAQVLKPLFDKLITTAKTKRSDVAIRHLNEIITDRNACRKILEVLVKRYATRTSGFTTIMPIGMRKGDGALLVDMQLMDAELDAPATAKDEKAAKPKKTPARSTGSGQAKKAATAAKA